MQLVQCMIDGVNTLVKVSGRNSIDLDPFPSNFVDLEPDPHHWLSSCKHRHSPLNFTSNGLFCPIILLVDLDPVFCRKLYFSRLNLRK